MYYGWLSKFINIDDLIITYPNREEGGITLRNAWKKALKDLDEKDPFEGSYERLHILPSLVVKKRKGFKLSKLVKN